MQPCGSPGVPDRIAKHPPSSAPALVYPVHGGRRVAGPSRSLGVGLVASVVSLHATGFPSAARAQVTALPTVEVSTSAPLPKRRPQNERRRHAEAPANGQRPARFTDNGPTVTAPTAGPVRGYQPLPATTATRTATPIERIPQSIAVVPRSVIDDQKALTVSEALQNVTSVGGVPPLFPYGVNYKVRGFPAERFVDAISNYNDAGDYASLVN